MTHRFACRVGTHSIDPDLVRRSNPVFRQMPTERFRTFHHGVLLEGDRWSVLIREFRNWIRDCMEESEFPEFHLFYRGPVAIGPLIGAMAVGRKPLNVYFLDEDSGLYRQAYRLDRRLLQEP